MTNSERQKVLAGVPCDDRLLVSSTLVQPDPPANLDREIGRNLETRRRHPWPIEAGILGKSGLRLDRTADEGNDPEQLVDLPFHVLITGADDHWGWRRARTRARKAKAAAALCCGIGR